MAAPQADLGSEYLETLLSSLRVRTSRKRPSHGTTSECETGGLSLYEMQKHWEQIQKSVKKFQRWRRQGTQTHEKRKNLTTKKALKTSI
jgi:hypothetical protein